jgi:predicted RNA-binding Zn-ribbon protein involved in translation (DUF1610 family)
MSKDDCEHNYRKERSMPQKKDPSNNVVTYVCNMCGDVLIKVEKRQ